jgi:hypothetical protein
MRCRSEWTPSGPLAGAGHPIGPPPRGRRSLGLLPPTAPANRAGGPRARHIMSGAVTHSAVPGGGGSRSREIPALCLPPAGQERGLARAAFQTSRAGAGPPLARGQWQLLRLPVARRAPQPAASAGTQARRRPANASAPPTRPPGARPSAMLHLCGAAHAGCRPAGAHGERDALRQPGSAPFRAQTRRAQSTARGGGRRHAIACRHRSGRSTSPAGLSLGWQGCRERASRRHLARDVDPSPARLACPPRFGHSGRRQHLETTCTGNTNLYLQFRTKIIIVLRRSFGS